MNAKRQVPEVESAADGIADDSARSERKGKHRKIAFLSPAGTIIGNNRVAAYHHDNLTELVNTDINIGDTFVFEATLQLLQFDEAVLIPQGGKSVEQYLDELSDCEVAVLRGSNYVHPQMNWGLLGEIIEKSSVPIVAFGIGAQAPRYEQVKLSEESIRVLHAISERSHSIGCRGQFTAEILEQHGIKNVVPIGCPSLFRANDRSLQVQMPVQDSIRRVAFTIARGIAGMYCDNAHVARRKQIQAIDELRQHYEIYLITQSEKSEKMFYFRAYDRIEEAKALIRKSGWDLPRMPWLEELYWSRIFFGTSPAAYESIMRFCDFTLGYRLHGNLMALSVGKPAIYHTYDSRTRELVEYFSIPHYDVMEQREFCFEEMIHPGLFDKFNARVSLAYDAMRDFLDSNRVPHRMTKS